MEKPEYLIKGSKIALRLWDENDVHNKPAHASGYETAGYVLEGTATLDLDGKKQEPENRRFLPGSRRCEAHIRHQRPFPLH